MVYEIIRIVEVPASNKGGLLKAIIRIIPNTDPGITYGDITKKSRMTVVLDFLRTTRYAVSMPITIIKAIAIVE